MPGDPVLEQPALAVCSGILIDWDLVLTGGHCVRRMALAELAVLFGFKYVAPGVLGELSADDVFYAEGIVSERLDASDASERVDYAAIRLSRSPGSPKAPVALRGTGSWGDNVGGRLGDDSARYDCAPTVAGTCQSAYRVPDAAFRSYTITSDDGAFAFATVPPRVVLDVSRPHESDAVVRRELDAPDAGLTHLKLKLPPARQAVRVIVLDERDQPVDAAQVLVTLPRAAISVQPGSVDGPGFALSHLQDGRRRA